MNIDDTKKNPKLGPVKYGVNIPYITAMDFLFKEERTTSINGVSRKTFLSYPKHLKMTLFIDDPKIDKIRKIEFMQRYMIVDEIKEAGNQSFNKGEY